MADRDGGAAGERVMHVLLLIEIPDSRRDDVEAHLLQSRAVFLLVHQNRGPVCEAKVHLPGARVGAEEDATAGTLEVVDVIHCRRVRLNERQA